MGSCLSLPGPTSKQTKWSCSADTRRNCHGKNAHTWRDSAARGEEEEEEDAKIPLEKKPPIEFLPIMSPQRNHLIPLVRTNKRLQMSPNELRLVSLTISRNSSIMQVSKHLFLPFYFFLSFSQYMHSSGILACIDFAATSTSVCSSSRTNCDPQPFLNPCLVQPKLEEKK